MQPGLLAVGALCALLQAGLLLPVSRLQAAVLPAPVEALLDQPRLPAAALDPQGRFLLLVHERGLLPLAHLNDASVSVAGHRLNPANGAPHAPIAYVGLSLVETANGFTRRIDLPEDVTIGYPEWAPDGSRFLFTVTSTTGVALWVGEPTSGIVREMLDAPLGAARGVPCRWMPDSRDVLCQVLAQGGGASVTPGRGGAGARAEEDALVERFLRARLELVDAVYGKRRPIGRAALIESIDVSPNGQFFLVERSVPPRLLPQDVDRRRVIEIWARDGTPVRTLSEGTGRTQIPRAVQWRATAPASIVWVERAFARDRVLLQEAPFSRPAREIHRTQHRFAGLQWLDDSALALIREYDPAHRITRAWLVDAEDPRQAPRRVGSRSIDAAYPALGRVLDRRNDRGKPVVRVVEDAVFTVGRSGEETYLDRLHLGSMKTERVWESTGSGYARIIDLLTDDGSLLLTRHESARRPPNYALHDLSTGWTWFLTDRAHPAPEFADVARVALRYQREDAVELSAVLYLPPDRASGAELPLLVWAYPRNYGHGSTPVAPDTRDRFPSFERAFKLFFVTQGYAVLDAVSMPVIGDTDTANDTFLQQIVANARAAVTAATATGLIDPRRIAIAGHSYGAFMVANLLAHTRLFSAGVAMSGSYNRTLTPFGFQTERRTLWEARDTYLAMSPYLYSDQIAAPLLLIHGEMDDNPGTPPIQSQYLYEAIRHNGGEAELLLLPFEGHTYRGRESVMRTAAAMLDWLDDHVGREGYPQRALAATGEDRGRDRSDL